LKRSSVTIIRRPTTYLLAQISFSGKWYVAKHNCFTGDVFNDYIRKNYMFRPVLAIFRLSYGNLRSYYKHARARGVQIPTYGPY